MHFADSFPEGASTAQSAASSSPPCRFQRRLAELDAESGRDRETASADGEKARGYREKPYFKTGGPYIQKARSRQPASAASVEALKPLILICVKALGLKRYKAK